VPFKTEATNNKPFHFVFPLYFLYPQISTRHHFFKKNVDEQQRQAKFLERTLPLSEKESLSLTKFGNKNWAFIDSFSCLTQVLNRWNFLPICGRSTQAWHHERWCISRPSPISTLSLPQSWNRSSQWFLNKPNLRTSLQSEMRLLVTPTH
jgi:hypothetical protein